MKKSQFYYEYENHFWKKPPYWLFYQRRKKGFSFEKSIQIFNLNRKTKIQIEGRVCTKCNKFKYWYDFNKTKTKIGYKPFCKECDKKVKEEYRSDPDNKKKELESKINYRKSEKGILKQKLDNLYYQDPIIINNRIILKQIKKPEVLRQTASQDKFFYFLSKGYDEKFLKEIYKIKEKKQLYNNN